MELTATDTEKDLATIIAAGVLHTEIETVTAIEKDILSVRIDEVVMIRETAGVVQSGRGRGIVIGHGDGTSGREVVTVIAEAVEGATMTVSVQEADMMTKGAEIIAAEGMMVNEETAEMIGTVTEIVEAGTIVRERLLECLPLCQGQCRGFHLPSHNSRSSRISSVMMEVLWSYFGSR